MKEAELRAEKLLDQAHQKLAQVQARIAELRRQRELFAAKIARSPQDPPRSPGAQPDRPSAPSEPCARVGRQDGPDVMLTVHVQPAPHGTQLVFQGVTVSRFV